jgi:predicted nucleic acid-binding protein
MVIDASVAVCWAMADEDHPVAAAALARVRMDEALVPRIWWCEVWNVLVMNERRGRITEAGTHAFLHTLSRMRITVDDDQDQPSVLALARKHRLSVYDAAYLALARREAIDLATLDTDLRRTAPLEGVVLLAPGPS